MNRTFLALSLAITVVATGCSSTKQSGLPPPTDTKVAIKDRTVAAHFRDKGIEVHYTWTGKLDKLVIWGVAPAWKSNYEILAEMDAKAKLTKFVHGESMDANTRTKIIARSLDRAQDNTLNRFDSNTSTDADFSFDVASIENEIQRTPPETNTDNISRRIAENIDRTMISQVLALTSSGRLTGVIKVDDGRSKDGKFYFAKYEWSEKTQELSQSIRNKMQ